MRQALLTCDRCGFEHRVPNGESAEGWRMIMNNVGVIDKDLCPACDAVIMAMFEKPGEIRTPLLTPTEIEKIMARAPSPE